MDRMGIDVGDFLKRLQRGLQEILGVNQKRLDRPKTWKQDTVHDRLV